MHQFRHRTLRFLGIAMLAMLLASCSGGKPESTLEAFYQAAAKGDVEKATELVSFENTPATQMVRAKGKVQIIIGEMQQRIDANDGLDRIETVSSKIDPDGKHAVVEVKLVFKNGKDVAETSKLVKGEHGWKISLK
jgi:PBP1b-binding outer membrane lipoprotein LpoB